MAKITIVGGGISGLATAYYLQKISKEVGEPVEITLLEKEKRLGGVFLTEKVDGFVVEGGPDSFELMKPWTLKLCEELGVRDRLVGANRENDRTFVFWNGKLHELPQGLPFLGIRQIRSFFSSSLISWLGKIRAIFEFVIPRRKDLSDESIASFFKRRFGKEVFEKAIEPLFGSIYACIPEMVSMKSCLPRYLRMEKKYGSIIRGMMAMRKRIVGSSSNHPFFMTFKEGTYELIDTLAAHIGEEVILTGKKVVSVKPISGKRNFEVYLDNGQSMDTDFCIIATPAYIVAELVENFDRALAELLRGIPWSTTATISLAYRGEDVSHPLEGFGFLVPRKERRKIKASTWSSIKFPHYAPPGYILLRCFIGAENQELVWLDDEALLDLVKEELKIIMDIDAEPVLAKIYRWEKSMPQYVLGHEERVAKIEGTVMKYPGLFLVGSSYRGVGIPDRIHEGELTAKRIINLLRTH